MKYRTLFISLSTFLLLSNTAVAELHNEQSQIEPYLEKLGKLHFLPRLLPVIIENSDIIELTDKQLNALLEWRKAHRDDVITTMKEIAGKRVDIKQASLSPYVSSARLIQMQNEIFRLQRKVLEHKLSCRELLINSFSKNNWEGLFLVLADNEIY